VKIVADMPLLVVDLLSVCFCYLQGSYRPWIVLEFYCSELQALESFGKGMASKILESPGIINQLFWNS